MHRSQVVGFLRYGHIIMLSWTHSIILLTHQVSLLLSDGLGAGWSANDLLKLLNMTLKEGRRERGGEREREGGRVRGRRRVRGKGRGREREGERGRREGGEEA